MYQKEKGRPDQRPESMMRNTDINRTTTSTCRRILAAVCAVTIAMLQCAVLISLDWDDVYAADHTVDVTINYNNGVVGTNTKTVKNDGSETGTFTVGENTITVKGKKVADIYEYESGDFDSLSFSKNAFIITSVEPETEKDKYLYHVYDNGGVIGDSVLSELSITRDKDAVSFKKEPTPSPAAAKKGEKITISYELEIDSFYKNSKEYDEDEDTAFSWSVKKGPFSLAEDSSSGIGKHSVTGEVTGDGEILVNYTNKHFAGSENTVNAKGEKSSLSISNATVTVADQTYAGGKELKPSPTVKLNGKTLKSGRDYTVSYANNKNVGTATITITGKGNYTGTKKATFKIVKKPKKTDPTKSETKKTTKKKSTESKGDKDLSNSDKVRVIKKEIAYYNNGKEVKPKFEVRYNDKVLKEGKDYTIEYSNNKKVGNDAKVTIKGKGDYTGETTRTFSISKKYSSNYNGGNYKYNFGGTRPTGATTATGTTVPTVTYAPDRTITVKEVHLGQKIEPTQETEPMDPMEGQEGQDPYDTENAQSIDVEEPAVEFGPAAGSAAVAALACGLGAVGRIRRFRFDMGPIDDVKAKVLGFGSGMAGTAAGKAAADKEKVAKGAAGSPAEAKGKAATLKDRFIPGKGRSAAGDPKPGKSSRDAGSTDPGKASQAKGAAGSGKSAAAQAPAKEEKKRKLPLPRRKDN